MKRKLLIVFGAIFTLSGLVGIVDVIKSFELTSLLAVLITLALGILMFIKGKKMPKTSKKQTYSFKTNVKGTFLEPRQFALTKLYNDYYDKELDENEVLISDKIKFVDEPENEYDEKAIAIFTLDNQQLGYVDKKLTDEFRKNINRDLPYKSYLTIYKSQAKYFADVQVLQNR